MKSIAKMLSWMLSPARAIQDGSILVPFFDLDADDCFEKIFDWLSLEDLKSLSQTSQRLQQITGKYLQKNYSGINVYCNRDKDGITALVSVEMNSFSEYIEKLTVSDGDFENFIYIADNCKSLKAIHFMHTTLTARKIRCIKKILEKIETLNIIGGKVNGDLHGALLNRCPNLKCLSIQNVKIKSSFDSVNDWLLKVYPKLKHFELIGYKNLRMNEIKSFFTIQNIRSFSTNAYLIDHFWTGFKEFDINLDDLTILIEYNERKMIQSICDELNALHDRGFFQRLHLKGNEICFFRNPINTIAKFKALESVNCEHLISPVTSKVLSALISLKQVEIFSSESCVNTSILAKGLLNLERVIFTYATLDHILPLIFYSVSLKEITLKKGIRAGSHIIPLPMLNKRRAILANACKITFFVNCKMYMETKMNIGKTNFNLIELKRT